VKPWWPTVVSVSTPAPTRTGWAAPRGPFPHPAAPSRPDGLAAVYRRHDPTVTPLYPLVQHHLETFLADAAAADPDGEAVPQWVEDDFRAYLRCGILAHGFARIRCDACAAERLVAFSCKGRGVCPSCNARRMVEVAAHLADHVLPPLPVRQWVLSLPKRIRPFLPHDPRLAGDVLRVLLRAIRTTLRRASPSAPADAQLGAVSFLHRFGSALPHFHFHVVVLDGVFSEGDDGSVTFHEATHLTADDVLRLERTLQRRVLRLFQRRGLLDEHTVEDMLTWQASGGFSLDASVRIHASDAGGRERLLRYCARPPFALERMRIERRGEGAGEHTATASLGDDGVRQVLYLPARPTRDGRTVLALSPLEFLAALSRLIPPPRVHRHRYHGVLAPNARLRERVINLDRHAVVAPGDTDSSPVLTPAAATAGVSAADLPDSPHSAAARSRWARLLARIYEVFPLTCPDCGGDMRILAFITAAEPVDAILTHLGLPTGPPPLAPARGPPQPELAFDAEPDLDLDQTPMYDLTEPEPIPDFDFDQSAGA
jgi:hypothetical protein